MGLCVGDLTVHIPAIPLAMLGLETEVSYEIYPYARRCAFGSRCSACGIRRGRLFSLPHFTRKSLQRKMERLCGLWVSVTPTHQKTRGNRNTTGRLGFFDTKNQFIKKRNVRDPIRRSLSASHHNMCSALQTRQILLCLVFYIFDDIAHCFHVLDVFIWNFNFKLFFQRHD